MVTERDDLTADGLRCATCSLRSEIEGHERNIADEAERKKQRGLYRRADWIGWAHAVVWGGTGELLLPRGGMVYAWWAIVLIIRVALFWRQRWALRLALGVDGAIIAFVVGLAISDRTSDMVVGAAVFAFFPLVLGALLYSLRRAYDPQSKVAPVSAPPPPQKWSAPGRQF
ncbi:MAG TPA: hypothetical protein VIA18_15260 [Polyangia bacterium]|jgi:hypothetical protein|nr:hypothetical protein [Polyangia bacterium]